MLRVTRGIKFGLFYYRSSAYRGIGQLILLLDQLEKDAKKLKKNRPNFEQGVKEFLQTYMMIVLELRSREL